MPRTAARKTTAQPAALITLQIPPLGAVWPGEGGRFAGIVFDDNGQPAYCLILHDQACAPTTWTDALKRAKALKTDGHADFRLPDRRDGPVLFANNHVLKIQELAHWLSEQYAGSASFAWCQYFNYGAQLNAVKDYQLRARAVRRLPIR